MTEASNGSTRTGPSASMLGRLWKLVDEAPLAVRVFVALAALLVVTITATSATLLYNSANTLRDEAEANAVRLAELLADSYAEMGEISLANVARTLDATLDTQMTAQARVAAEMVAAAEAAGYDAARLNETLDEITRDTVIDEFWITDEVGFSYLTNVKDEAGVRVPFRFDPDPAVQPQASKFFVLLAAPPDDDGFIVQPAVVREIDSDIVKYVGVGGIDQSRIVQVGNVFNFGDQEILSNLAASERGDVSDVIEGILGQQMTGQAELVRRFVVAAEEGGWSTAEINERLLHITGTTVIGEVRVADASGKVLYSNLPASETPDLVGAMPYFEDFAAALGGSSLFHEHPSEPRPSDGLVYKYVAAADPDKQRIVQVGILIESSYGNLLYSVYQREADVLVRAQNIDTIWIVNQDRELAAAAPRLALQSGDDQASLVEQFESGAGVMVQTAMADQRVTSRASLSLFSPEARGIVVAAPIINTGGIAIGALAIEVGLDEIAGTVISEGLNTTAVAFLLLVLTGGGALWGSRKLTRPIETIAEAAKQVEGGTQPESPEMAVVLRRGDEIGRLARVFSDMTVQVFNREEELEKLVAARTQELEASNRQLRLAYEAMEQDLEMAKVVQAALVQQGNTNVGNLTGHARMTPAQMVGGDLIEMHVPEAGKLFVALGDVSGKGVAAALFMAASSAAIRAASADPIGVDIIAADINNRLCAENPMGLFVTCLLAVFDLDNGTVEYTCAGHDPALLIKPDGNREPLPTTGDMAMGIMEDFDYSSRRAQLAPGDTFFVYTDGLTDAVNRKGKLFGHEGLERALDGAGSRSPEEMVNHIWLSIEEFSEGTAPTDDKTCLVLRRRD
ncbi:MAG: SpoIIE family protein phosphatase [Acidobacteria bacterium]|nr:SpoIIE family protein phosphatase [Acidobacteriota bacterium]